MDLDPAQLSECRRRQPRCERDP